MDRRPTPPAPRAVLRRPPPIALRAALRGVARLGALLGPGRHRLADVVSTAAYLTHPTAAARTARNHRRADPSLGARAARRRARASFREFGRMVADTIWLNGASNAAILQRARVTGWENLDAARAGGRGAVLAACHVGSWDMALGVGLARGMSIASVMAPVGPAWVTGVVAWDRTRRGLRLFGMEAAARGFLSALRSGGLVAVMMDIPEAGPVAVVDFCGGRVRFSAVAASLALRTGSPILVIDCWRIAGGHRVEISAPVIPGADEDEEALTQRLASLLERGVRSHPEQWYPFHEVYVDPSPPG